MEALKDFFQGKWLGHLLHPALVHVPTALWPAALLFDLLSGRGGPYAQLSFWAIGGGLLAALAAAPAGLADWADIRREKPAWRLALVHMLLNLTVIALQAINWWTRLDGYAEGGQAAGVNLGLSALATALLLISGWIGGRMIYGYGINVARLSKKMWREAAQAGGARIEDSQKPAGKEGGGA